jgi:hypothetical protein
VPLSGGQLGPRKERQAVINSSLLMVHVRVCVSACSSCGVRGECVHASCSRLTHCPSSTTHPALQHTEHTQRSTRGLDGNHALYSDTCSTVASFQPSILCTVVWLTCVCGRAAPKGAARGEGPQGGAALTVDGCCVGSAGAGLG